MKRRTLIVLVTLAALVVVIGGVQILIARAATALEAGLQPEQFDQIRVAEHGLEIRVTAFKESGWGLNAPGGIYRYEFRVGPGSAWSTITSFRYSHPDDIPREQIRILDSQRAYFFHEFLFAVTLDGGATWAVRGDPEASFNTLHQWTSPRITNVSIDRSGTGHMSVEPYRWQQLESSRLVTSDHGRTWRFVSGP